MIPKYSNLYEELPDDIFAGYRDPFPIAPRIFISSFTSKALLDSDLMDQCKIISAWANTQGLIGNIVSDIKFENPVFSENPFSDIITVTCVVSKKNLGYVGKEFDL